MYNHESSLVFYTVNTIFKLLFTIYLHAETYPNCKTGAILCVSQGDL
jgi:hypothetical protein